MRSLTFVCVAAARVVFRCLIGASRPALAGLLAAAALCALRAPRDGPNHVFLGSGGAVRHGPGLRRQRQLGQFAHQLVHFRPVGLRLYQWLDECR